MPELPVEKAVPEHEGGITEGIYSIIIHNSYLNLNIQTCT